MERTALSRTPSPDLQSVRPVGISHGPYATSWRRAAGSSTSIGALCALCAWAWWCGTSRCPGSQPC